MHYDLILDASQLLKPEKKDTSIADTGLPGFVKLKSFQKSMKNSEVGGSVKPKLGF